MIAELGPPVWGGGTGLEDVCLGVWTTFGQRRLGGEDGADVETGGGTFAQVSLGSRFGRSARGRSAKVDALPPCDDGHAAENTSV